MLDRARVRVRILVAAEVGVEGKVANRLKAVRFGLMTNKFGRREGRARRRGGRRGVS